MVKSRVEQTAHEAVTGEFTRYRPAQPSVILGYRYIVMNVTHVRLVAGEVGSCPIRDYDKHPIRLLNVWRAIPRS